MLLFRPLFRPLRGRGRGFLLFILNPFCVRSTCWGIKRTSVQNFTPYPLLSPPFVPPFVPPFPMAWTIASPSPLKATSPSTLQRFNNWALALVYVWKCPHMQVVKTDGVVSVPWKSANHSQNSFKSLFVISSFIIRSVLNQCSRYRPMCGNAPKSNRLYRPPRWSLPSP